MMHNIDKLSDAELVKIAGSNITGTAPDGALAQQAQAELLRRNTEELNRASRAAEDHNSIMFHLTMVILFVAMVQIVVAIFTSSLGRDLQFIFALMVLGAIFVVVLLTARDRQKDREKLGTK